MKKFLCCIMVMLMCFTITKVNASDTFFDTRGTKYEGVVERMAKLGIVNGMTETTFAPNKGVTRAELAKIVTKLRGIEDYAESVEYKKTFSDVSKDDWFYPYVIIASDLEMINGYEDGTFKPNKEVTYAELIAILLRNLGYTNITEDSQNGWYWNYVAKMRELELNDNVGEFNYTMPAKRGDVAMFAWNALITDRWAISLENNVTGFTYTYSDETQLEMFFEDYNFVDNEVVLSLGATEERVDIHTNKGVFYTSEKTPLYVLGGRVTGLYNEKTNELIGVTFDEDYPDEEIISGPEFYLKEQGYKISTAVKTATYGTKSKANYVYLVINKETDRIIRAVYLDASNTIHVDSISVSKADESGDRGPLKEIKLNDGEYSSTNFAVISDGLPKDIESVKTGDILTYLGDGLYIYSNQKLTNTLTDYNFKDKKIKIGEDEYIVSENCLCLIYGDKEKVSFDSVTTKKINDLIGTEITVVLNVAEEVCDITFGKTKEDNEKYKIGFITEVRHTESESIARINYGNSEKKNVSLQASKDRYPVIGDFVVVYTSDGKKENKYITSDITFDNEIGVKYEYEPKKISYPMIGEYIVTEDTLFYKVTLEYEDNSVTSVKKCTLSKMEIDENIEDLSAYKITLIYNENMEIVKVYAVNEVNKFENQIALVKDIKRIVNEDGKKVYKVTANIVNNVVTGFEVNEQPEEYSSGDIITFKTDDKSVFELDEVFRKEFIGYQRDLTVKSYDYKTKTITFTDDSKMVLTEDIYNLNGTRINLNKYRFIITNVSKENETYKFTSASIKDKEDVRVEKGDKFAIGELQDVIVIYRGYKD